MNALCGFWLTDTNTLFSIEGLERLIPERPLRKDRVRGVRAFETRHEGDGLSGEKRNQEKMGGQTTQLRGIDTQYESIG